MPKIEYKGYTDYINRHPAINICHGFDFARHLGRPLNNYVVINFDGQSGYATTFQRIRDKFRNWFNRRTKQLYGEPLPPMYVYTLESPGDHVHVNWVVNIPPALQAEFDKKRRRWIEKAKGGIGPFDELTKRVDPATDKTLAKYILKGISPLYIAHLHLGDYATHQGRVWGRRAGTSPALSRTARDAAGFVAKRHRKSWRPAASNEREAA